MDTTYTLGYPKANTEIKSWACEITHTLGISNNKIGVENVRPTLYNNNPNERKQMTTTLEVGQTYTTTTSGITGVIKAVDNHPSGTNRILLDVNGKERWTSAPAN